MLLDPQLSFGGFCFWVPVCVNLLFDLISNPNFNSFFVNGEGGKINSSGLDLEVDGYEIGEVGVVGGDAKLWLWQGRQLGFLTVKDLTNNW
jgi:hypothetical protein